MDDNKVYANGKIFQKGQAAIMAKNLVLSNDSIHYIDEFNTSKVMALSSNDIRAVAVNNGTQLLTFSACGGILGLLVSLEAKNYVINSTTEGNTNVNWTKFIVGYTIGGIVIGALIGTCTPKWKTLLIPEKNKTGCLFKISPNISKNECGLSLKIIL